MHIKPIKYEEAYEAVLKQIENFWNPRMGSSEGDILEVLTILIAYYEKNITIYYHLTP